MSDQMLLARVRAYLRAKLRWEADFGEEDEESTAVARVLMGRVADMERSDAIEAMLDFLEQFEEC